MEELITIENVVKNDDKGNAILKGISAKVMDGELITIIGPSGSGKSTFLSLLNRMTDPDSGIIRFKGKNYLEMNVLELRRKIGMVFQVPTMLSGTVRENLLIGPKLFRQTLSEEEIDNLLEQVALPKTLKDQDARTLSGGQKQRVSLARTLANKPEILLLDEVTASLDPTSSLEIEGLVQVLHEQQRKTILWVTHNLKQAKRVGQYTWVIANGKIVEQGPTEEVFENPQHEITKEFIVTAFDQEGEIQ
ncbi:phosphate ABC transporter ATP-binding protein [Tepidibacillus fermentans]|uniref:Phosphate ABC transporter ATP-binding protein (PhoT family) n=1 Tax=Tepidibacillus fermentans TaxID=1281767 RepID=A0A4R3KGD8_9BACI|nr:phosphate ABC transporter ATP-binding protein [Tepidibacillus fermentans]TCS82484.1 phosphate ABC transporter ATP-binding protein (PhoT family) [Tepidibacillus fermentans]